MKKEIQAMSKNVFDEQMIKMAILLDEGSKTAIFLSSVLKACNGEEVELTDPLVKFSFESQKHKIDAFLRAEEELFKKRSLAGKIAAKARWNK